MDDRHKMQQEAAAIERELHDQAGKTSAAAQKALIARRQELNRELGRR